MAAALQAQQRNVERITSEPGFEIITTMCYSLTLPANPISVAAGCESASAPEIAHCYLLPYGLDRLRAAASALSWPDALASLNAPDKSVAAVAGDIQAYIRTTHCTPAVDLDPAQRFIVRLALRRSGELTIRSAPRPTISAAIPYFPTALAPPPPAGDFDAASTHLGDIPVVKVRVDPGRMRADILTTHKTSWRGAYNAARARAGVSETTPFAEGEVLVTNEAGEVMGACFTTVYFFRDGRWVTPPAGNGCKEGVSRRWALERGGVEERIVRVEEVKDREMIWLSSAVGGFCWGVVTYGAKTEE